MFRILSIDGGGVRGIFPAYVLKQLSDTLGGQSLRDVFDLVIGTSTGGIIAAAVAQDIPLQRVVELYEQEAPAIFGRKHAFNGSGIGVVMQEVLDVPDNIPQQLLEKAECVLVIPSMTKIAVGVGGSHGRGAMSCRTGALSGPWGAPAMHARDGGSVGLQLGAESTEVVLLVMNRRGVDALLDSNVKLGGNASVAAGPKGRNLEATTDLTMRAEVLSYSRACGLFAGPSLESTSVRRDDGATESVYGRKLAAGAIVAGTRPVIAVPPAARQFVDALQKNTPRNLTKRATR